ncbi:T9SS type A sorting domain-containing protein [Dyadobacter jiangsuensis]|uniref:Putative secreted protein (Por secretion system target) n=1 Tax=Dyadobacter jiangsuensis TaxID=1591085 RepID=A0A2P8FGG2_9BACT|nr:T9SS type A sorting domain-containing protein [Dyadobacter jiangsuensis]PSL20799.1 putative secreted protein (Por secretion system target) [Dyadobacter jiangsuensis]
MKLRKLLLAALCLFAKPAFAQDTEARISVENDYYAPICSFKEMKIRGSVTGKFNSDNKFYVELISGVDFKPVGRYEAVYQNGNFVFSVGDDKAGGSERITFKVLSTSPATETYPLSRPFYSRGQVSLARDAGMPDTLNAGIPMGIFANVSTNNPVRVTLNDSSTHEVRWSSDKQVLSLAASASTEFFIVKAVNSCEVAVPFSGKISVKINPVTIIPTKITNDVLCEGSEIQLKYAVAGGTIPESATFKLRLLIENNPQTIIEIPAQRKGEGILTAKIPDNILTYSSYLKAAIVVNGPKMVSPYSESFQVHEKPTASFQSESGTARMRQQITMWFNVSGPAPHVIELSNGRSYQLDNNRNINLYLLKTETFSIKSLKTACGVTTDLPKQNIVMTIPDGIVINGDPFPKWEVCENQTVRLPFAANVPLNANTKFTFEGITAKKTVYKFEAKLVNDSLEFFIPHSPASWVTEGYFSITDFRVTTTNPSYASEYRNGLTIRGIPRISFETYQPRTLPYPKYYEYKLLVHGGAPFGMTDESGYKSYWRYGERSDRIFVPTSGNYGPKSVENACYATSDLAKMNFTVQPYSGQQPVIIVHPPAKRYYCETDSVEVWFETLGKFDSGNEFRIKRYDGVDGGWLKVSKPGKYKLPALALESNTYTQVGVESTSPVVKGGSDIWLVVNKKPELQSLDELSRSTPERPEIFNVDQIPAVSTQLKEGSPYTAEWTDGVKNYHFEEKLQYEAFYPPMTRGKVTPYTLKSVGNACGNTNFDLTMYFYWKAYDLAIDYFTDNQVFCTGEELVVPFQVRNGSAPNGTTFRLRLVKDDGSVQTVASGTSLADLKYIIPDTMEGVYHLWVSSDAGTSSQLKTIKVKKKPTATITYRKQAPGTAAEIEFGESVFVDYQLTGGSPWKVLLEGRSETVETEEVYWRQYEVVKSTIFKLTSVSNECGYGSVSGNVPVKIKPKIVTFAPATSVCGGNTLGVRYEVGGDIPVGEKIGFFLTNANGSRFDLLSATSARGTISLPVPTSLAPGSYTITCYITGSDISVSQQISIVRAPDIELMGYTTINPGEAAYIQVRPKTIGNQTVDVTFSDGVTLNFLMPGLSSVYDVRVVPAKTTTYTIVSASGSCGPVKASGSATVVVNAPSERKIRVTNLNKFRTFCEKDTLLVHFSQSGTFSAGNQFTVQFRDTQGKLVGSVPASGKTTPLQAIVPAGLTPGEGYRVRITASDANTASSDFQQVMMLSEKASAAFASDNAILDETGRAKVVVLLKGTGQWQYRYGNDVGSVARFADVSPDTILITSKEPSAYFKLLSVSNGCGAGTLNEPSIVKVEVILGTEDPDINAGEMSVGPNPTSAIVIIRFKTGVKRSLSLYNASGAKVWAKTSSANEEAIDMKSYPAGIYLFKAEHNGKMQLFRVLKE